MYSFTAFLFLFFFAFLDGYHGLVPCTPVHEGNFLFFRRSSIGSDLVFVFFLGNHSEHRQDGYTDIEESYSNLNIIGGTATFFHLFFFLRYRPLVGAFFLLKETVS